MAARPPEGLDEVRTVAEAVQRGEEVTLQEHGEQVDRPTVRPQTVEDVRKALEGSEVIVYERRNQEEQALDEEVTLSPPDRQACLRAPHRQACLRAPHRQACLRAPHRQACLRAPHRQAQVDKLVADYAARLRRILSRSGRKPFRLAGLQLYADLLDLLVSLEVSLSHLPEEQRLTCFADAIRRGLQDFEEDYIWIAEGYTWVVDIADIGDKRYPLDVSLPEPGSEAPETPLSDEVRDRLNAYLDQLDQRTDLNVHLIAFRQHLRGLPVRCTQTGLTERYAPGLFHCYDIPGLPRTDNDLESVFGRVRRQTLRTSGPHHAQQRLHEEGAWLIFDLVHSEHEQLERLQRVSLDDWREERQRIRKHVQPLVAGYVHGRPTLSPCPIPVSGGT